MLPADQVSRTKKITINIAEFSVTDPDPTEIIFKKRKKFRNIICEELSVVRRLLPEPERPLKAFKKTYMTVFVLVKKFQF